LRHELLMLAESIYLHFCNCDMQALLFVKDCIHLIISNNKVFIKL